MVAALVGGDEVKETAANALPNRMLPVPKSFLHQKDDCEAVGSGR